MQRSVEGQEGQEGQESQEGQEAQEGQEGHLGQLSGWCSPIMEGSCEASGSGSQSGVAQEEDSVGQGALV